MTGADLDWEALQRVWTAPDPGADARIVALRKAVLLQATRLRLLLAAEIATTVVILSGVALFALRHPGALTATLVVAALVHSAVVWAYTLWTRRGHWNPATDTLRAAVAARVAHCRRRLATYRFLYWMALVETVLVIAAAALNGAFVYSALFVTGFFAGALLWTRWDGRRVARELALLESWQRDMAEDASPTSRDSR